MSRLSGLHQQTCSWAVKELYWLDIIFWMTRKKSIILIKSIVPPLYFPERLSEIRSSDRSLNCSSSPANITGQRPQQLSTFDLVLLLWALGPSHASDGKQQAWRSCCRAPRGGQRRLHSFTEWWEMSRGWRGPPTCVALQCYADGLDPCAESTCMSLTQCGVNTSHHVIS